MDDWLLSGLNAAQRRAVQHFCGPLLVVAGAGSGKTRTLTYRIAYLLEHYRVDPEHIVAVTFTNKAAREIKTRVEDLLAQRLAQRAQEDWTRLSPAAQQHWRSQVYQQFTRYLWMGTFHSLCARLLRYDIEKYRDEQGRQWTRNFTILDENDAQSLIKQIVNEMNLDERRFEPRQVYYTISRLKNQGKTPSQYEREEPNYRGRVIAEVYSRYQQELARNNSLDFDDLLLVPVRLFRQNEQVLAYWHQRFRHIAVDEYQDTNHIQYEFIRLLVTQGAEIQDVAWDNRSIFVVGDADQSIYRFRGADFTILMNFQNDFGDRLPDDDTRTMVKLEDNYRSVANILEAANHLIRHNQERIDKVLRPTREAGHKICTFEATDERDEADYVLHQLRRLRQQHPEYTWRSFAILYRTNAQSRVLEEVLVRGNVPYRVVGGVRFYERKEIKDALAYLRLLVNPADNLSLLRVINTPKRGLGKVTLDQLVQEAMAQGRSLWQVLTDPDQLAAFPSRTRKGLQDFVQLIERWQQELNQKTAPEIIQGILTESGYRRELEQEGTDEALERLQNLQELVNAAIQYGEENDDPSLVGFLASASLASDTDELQEGADRVTLMTLHASKGLEFPVVFLVGLEQGLFPNFRALHDPAALEEERRLCYVGITRAKERLFLTHATSRRLYGNQREPAMASMFLQELPPHVVEMDRGRFGLPAPNPPSKPRSKNTHRWQVGDRCLHQTIGVGKVVAVSDDAKRPFLFVRFENRFTLHLIDPRREKLIPLED
ncbi:MAG: DNA helicase PcrA [Gloeomargarita sp. SKYBB_i_bin120]|nr:DNA helicase PcrA [Gloeomargarita sp. SKYG98]MCS7292242.1 DNA helicase PcrA [Gloeomargarita sp. SKYB120]MDW8177803.1 DNA helicase PcrA [Gloeomargarita sp. SKYBB_i_bin120]